MDDGNLRDKAREALLTGKLPCRRPDRVWGGAGAGTPCTVCGTPVRPDEVGFEMEFDAAGRTHHVHIRCFSALEMERASRVADGGNGLQSAAY
jgi:hypothetical protein